ncbi:MAG: ATP-binding protein [Betaproteobacteria bacterium]
MESRLRALPFTSWLFGAAAGFALILAVQLGAVLQVHQGLAASKALHRDTPATPAAALELEFLQFQRLLQIQLNDPGANDSAALAVENDALFTRVQLLRQDPVWNAFSAEPQNAELLRSVHSIHDQVGAALTRTAVDLVALRSVAQTAGAIAPQLVDFKKSAQARADSPVDTQADQLGAYVAAVAGLALLQAAVLCFAGMALYRHNRKQVNEQTKSYDLAAHFQESQLQAERANRGKSQFLANMSHELRTPFNGILGMLSLLSTTGLSTQQADYVKTANVSASHLLNVLNDILDVSALEEGKISIQREPVNLLQLLHEIEETTRPQTQAKKLAFKLTRHGHIPDWVITDGTRLRQILFNLINNSIKFTPQGSITLTVSGTSPKTHANGPTATVNVLFAVDDTGIGMESDVLDRLFQRFYQVDSGVARQYGGTGLGLEISQSLAGLMGGNIDVKSTPGAGSCFSLELPLQLCPAPPSASSFPTVGQSPAADESHHSYRILVAEDNPVNRKFVGILLERMGYRATFCENGLLAVQQLQAEDFDLVLMDVHMPVMDGLAATRAIRALASPAAHVPIIALTADVMKNAQEEAAAAGVSCFVTKPVHMARLQEAIKQLLDGACETAGTSPSSLQASALQT